MKNPAGHVVTAGFYYSVNFKPTAAAKMMAMNRIRFQSRDSP